MTTICYKNGELAADSLVTDNGVHIGLMEKACVLDDGSVVGAAGQAQCTAAFFRWLAAGEPTYGKPKVPQEFEAFRVYPGLRVFNYECDLVPYQWNPFNGVVAIGSGYEIALGAMYAGATAWEACTIAAQLDRNTGGRIQTFCVRG